MQLHLLIPLAIPAAASVLILIHRFLFENTTGLWWFTVLVLVNSIIAVCLVGTGELPLLRFSRTTNFFGVFLLLALLASFVCLGSYLNSQRKIRGEWCFFYLSCAVGTLIAVYAVDLLLFYIGLEVATVAMVFLGLISNRDAEIELSGRFLYFNIFSSLVILLSLVLYYFNFGSMSLVGQKIAAGEAETFLLLFFVALVLKLGLGPFYYLAVDFYHGTPLPVSLALATAVRGSGLYFFIKASRLLLDRTTLVWTVVVGGIAVGGTLVAALHAHVQNDSRRKLAGLLTSRWGLVLVPLVAAGSSGGLGAAQFALPALILTLLLAGAGYLYFKVTPEPGGPQSGRMSRARTVQKALVALLVAGMPPAAGFAALFLIGQSVVKAELTPLLLTYLPVYLLNALLAVGIFTEFEVDSWAIYEPGKHRRSPGGAGVVVGLSLVGLAVLGFWPELIFELGPPGFG